MRRRIQRRKARCVCGRVVAVRFGVQEWSGGPGKARVRHKCPHGRWCVAGRLSHGFVTNFTCPECVQEEIDSRAEDQ